MGEALVVEMTGTLALDVKFPSGAASITSLDQFLPFLVADSPTKRK